MENASKALIIAGAILLSILIIGLGMFIFTQAQDAIGNTGIDEQKVNAHNNRFLNYEGVQSGSSVRTLLNTIITYNITGAEDASQYITAAEGEAPTSNGADGAEDATALNASITTLRNGIKAGYSYTVKMGYDPKTGYIVGVGITQNK